jgi:plastocyanin
MSMRKLRALMFVLMVGSICGAPALVGGGAAVSAQSPVAVDVVDFKFDPAKFDVEAGTTVTWTNGGARPHTVTDRGGPFDTGPVAPGANASITFSTPGRYFFFCRINPSKMNGVLDVDAGAEPAKTVRVQALDPAREDEELGFDPDELEVEAGTAVVLANVGGKPHSLTADDGTFDTGIVNPGAQGGRFAGANASIVPTTAGTFPFHCEVHPEAMKGVLTVTGEAPPDAAASSSAPNKASVKIIDFAFDPKEASVAPGGTVTWTNTGQAPHTATFDDVENLDSGQLSPASEGALVAPAEPGSYSYRCTVHPAQMRGVLVVVGQATGDPTKVAVDDAKTDVAAGAGPGGGVSTLALATGVGGAFLGGFALSQFVRNKPSA